MWSPSRTRRSRLAVFLVPAALLALAGCGSAWRAVPVASVDESTETLGEYARFTLNDQRVLEVRVSQVNYPWVEGNRIVSDWTNGRTVRVDLRQVAKIEVRGTSAPPGTAPDGPLDGSPPSPAG